jgi:hypothetical protein
LMAFERLHRSLFRQAAAPRQLKVCVAWVACVTCVTCFRFSMVSQLMLMAPPAPSSVGPSPRVGSWSVVMVKLYGRRGWTMV